MDFLDVLFSVAPENPPRVDLPEIGRSDVARAGQRGLDADGETGPETVNLGPGVASWAGAVARGKIEKADAGNFLMGGSCRPIRDSRRIYIWMLALHNFRVHARSTFDKLSLWKNREN